MKGKNGKWIDYKETDAALIASDKSSDYKREKLRRTYIALQCYWSPWLQMLIVITFVALYERMNAWTWEPY